MNKNPYILHNKRKTILHGLVDETQLLGFIFTNPSLHCVLSKKHQYHNETSSIHGFPIQSFSESVTSRFYNYTYRKHADFLYSIPSNYKECSLLQQVQVSSRIGTLRIHRWKILSPKVTITLLKKLL